jgi:hypothetical protein
MRTAMHPSELPEHLWEAVKAARMSSEHDHLNALLDEEPSPRGGTMSEMVERVARVLARHYDLLEHGVASDATWQGWTDAARAAIEAMREPTDAMLDAPGDLLCAIGDQAEYEGKFMAGFDDIEDASEAIWKQMIDAALKP